MARQTNIGVRRNGHALGRKQAGLSFIAWVAILAVAAVFASVGLKTIPHYLENQTIIKVVEAVGPAVLKSGSKKKVYEAVDKRLKINNVRDYQAKDILDFKRAKDANYWVLEYEVRENVISNLDLLIAFSKELR